MLYVRGSSKNKRTNVNVFFAVAGALGSSDLLPALDAAGFQTPMGGRSVTPAGREQQMMIGDMGMQTQAMSAPPGA